MFKSIIALTVIPIIGYLISFIILNSAADDLTTVSELIKNVQLMCSQDYQTVCSTFDNIILLRDVSIYSGIASFLIIFIYYAFAKIAGTNRDLISKLFPPLIPIILILISAQTIVQGVILTYSAYIAESYFLGVVHFFLIGAIGFGAAVGAFQIIGSVFSLTKKLIHTQIGQKLLSSEQPKIWDLVNNIANEIGSKPPDNIIVGIEPTFYATAADIVGCGKETLSGETLYLSLPLMRLFNKSELKAVIGHELGHFSSKDTDYSTKFAPVYRGLGNSINLLTDPNEGGTGGIATLAPLLVLSSMYDIFSENVAFISREREFEADKVGVSVSSPRDLAYSLTKVTLFSSMWNEVRGDNIRRLNQGKISPNLSEIFMDSAAFNLSKNILEEEKESILNSSIFHPTDSHPPLSDRLESIGYKSDEIVIDEVLNQGDSCSDLILDAEKIEEDMTDVEHRMILALGLAVIPEEDNQGGNLEAVVYSMAAAMIGADGRIEQEEVEVAEQIGIQLINTFDKTDFRQYIKNLDSVPNIIDLAKKLSSMDKTNKGIIFSYLEAIANADEDLAEEEQKILNELKKIWSIDA